MSARKTAPTPKWPMLVTTEGVAAVAYYGSEKFICNTWMLIAQQILTNSNLN
jgi:hypothetical protein